MSNPCDICGLYHHPARECPPIPAASDPYAELAKAQADLALATRLLRRAVTELNHHVCYEDEETMEFLEREKEG